MWVPDVHCSCEVATNEELVEYFVQEGPVSEQQSRAWVSHRDYYRITHLPRLSCAGAGVPGRREPRKASPVKYSYPSYMSALR
jgi:hypothetical protein